MKPTEPPYDGKPCPVCPSEIRNLLATAHNLAWRLVEFNGESLCKVIDKLYELRRAVQEVVILVDAPAELHHLHDVAARVATALSYPELFALGKELQKARDAVRPLSDAHFADRRHSHGE